VHMRLTSAACAQRAVAATPLAAHHLLLLVLLPLLVLLRGMALRCLRLPRLLPAWRASSVPPRP
jgi:hypothetical protein